MENETKNELITEGEGKTDNELIAEFMGFPYKRTGLTFSEPRTLFVSKAKLEYHTSWDWLMPVVEKIHKVKGIHYIIEGSCGMVIHHFGKQIIKNSSDSIIETVYKSVVDFVKWYNKTQSRGGGN